MNNRSSTETSDLRYRALLDAIDEGFCIIEVLFERDGTAVDYRFLETNAAFDAQTGLRRATGRRMRELAPLHEEHWFRIYGDVALTGRPVALSSRQLRWDVGTTCSRSASTILSDIMSLSSSRTSLNESAQSSHYGRATTHFGEAKPNMPSPGAKPRMRASPKIGCWRWLPTSFATR